MNKLDTGKRAQVVAALVEGCSIRSTVRMTGVAKNTIQKLLLELGAACSKYMDENMRNLPCKPIQADEIWSFVYAKAKNVKPEMFDAGGYAGDLWTWIAMDAIRNWCRASWLTSAIRLRRVISWPILPTALRTAYS